MFALLEAHELAGNWRNVEQIQALDDVEHVLDDLNLGVNIFTALLLQTQQENPHVLEHLQHHVLRNLYVFVLLRTYHQHFAQNLTQGLNVLQLNVRFVRYFAEIFK